MTDFKVDSQEVYDQLDDLGIEYEIVHHPPALTTEQADKFIEGVDGVCTKTMLLTDRKKKNFFMIIMGDHKEMDMKELADTVGANRLQFAAEKYMLDKIKLKPGFVSVFGLTYNTDRDIKVFLDREIASERRQSFHPNDNTQTVFLKTEDMLRYIESLGYEVEIIDV